MAITRYFLDNGWEWISRDSLYNVAVYFAERGVEIVSYVVGA